MSTLRANQQTGKPIIMQTGKPANQAGKPVNQQTLLLANISVQVVRASMF